VSRQNTQEVCPWNPPKFLGLTIEPDFDGRLERQHAPAHANAGAPDAAGSGTVPGTEAPSLIDPLEAALDEGAWGVFSRGSAIRRAGRAGFARNVCVGRPRPLHRSHSSCLVSTGAPLMRPVYPSRSPPTTKPRFVISYSRYALLCWLPRIFTTAATFFSSLSTST
jgi:hypothetical protein